MAERSGLIVRSARGLYIPADVAVTEFHIFAEVAKRVPRGMICLLSALRRFHDVGTQNPSQIWLVIGEKEGLGRNLSAFYGIADVAEAAN